MNQNPNFPLNLPRILPSPGSPFVPASPISSFFNQRHRLGVDTCALPVAVRALLEKPVSYFKELAQKKTVSFRPALTHIAFALDCSGSMEQGKGTTIEGFNNQVKVVQEGSKSAGLTLFTEVHFGDTAVVRRVAGSLDSLSPLSIETYKPSGMTALNDGIGDAVAALLQTEGIDDPNTATLVTVFTDGGENSSVRYSAAVLKELIERLEATGRWTFALVGPSGSVQTLAKSLSVRADNVAAYDPSSVQSRTQAFGSVVAASASFMSVRSAGGTQASNLYVDPRA